MTDAEAVVTSLMRGKRLVIASNRGPAHFDRDENGELIAERGAGGLVTAMSQVLEQAGATWVACPMTDGDKELAASATRVPMPSEDPVYHLRFASIDSQEYDLYYNEISNKILWFDFHYLWDLPLEPSFNGATIAAWNDGYARVNRDVAETIADECRAGAIEDPSSRPVVLLHDYHLMTAGQYVRELVPDVILTHFLHIPWPDPDYFKVLPTQIREEILEGMLACDVLGFHAQSYGDNFLSCVAEVMGLPVDWESRTTVWRGRTIRVRTYPISIHPDGLSKLSASDEVGAWEDRIAEIRGDCKMLLRIDRVDPAKNALRGFQAYDQMLSEHPELVGKVMFFAFLNPSREEVQAYHDYLESTQALVAEINERHGTDGWIPIHLEIEDDFPRSVAGLKNYDLLLVNSTQDGMNLVAKEGPILNENDGMLILSEGCGASNELEAGAIIVNPFDIGQTSEAMYRGLTVTAEERKARAELLVEVVSRNNILKWLYHQLYDIDQFISDEGRDLEGT